MNLIAAFLLGLAGSLHCAVMCGPLLLAVNMARRQNPAQNFSYHAGRIGVYLALGAISGLIGGAVVLAGFQRWLSLAAGIVVLAAACLSTRPGKLVLAVKTRFSRLLTRRTFGASALLGGLNGLLPCGLVYMACATAAAAGSVRGGIATMLAFGLGTAPMLLSIAIAGRTLVPINPLRLKQVLLICAAIAGLLLIARSLSIGPEGTMCGHSVAAAF